MLRKKIDDHGTGIPHHKVAPCSRRFKSFSRVRKDSRSITTGKHKRKEGECLQNFFPCFIRLAQRQTISPEGRVMRR